MRVRAACRRGLSVVAAGTVIAAVVAPLSTHLGRADAATTRQLSPGTNITVPGVSTRLSRLGAQVRPHVEPPHLLRPGAHSGDRRAAGASVAAGGATSSAVTAAYPVPGRNGFGAVDAERSAPSAPVRVAAASGPTSVGQLGAIQGVSRTSEKTAFAIEATPPDTQVAVSPSQVVEAVNTVALVMNHDGGGASMFDLHSVWQALVPGLGTGSADLSDPRIVWDTESSRWFLSAVIYDTSLLDPNSSPAVLHSSHSWVGVAVSKGSAPTTWTAYVLPPAGAAGVLLDQPGLGVSSDKVTLSSDNFDFTQAQAPFVGSELFVANKSEMLNATTPLDVTTRVDATAFGYAPAVARSATTTEYVAYNNNGNAGQPQKLSVVAISGVPAGSTSASFVQHDMVMCSTCGNDAVTATPPPIAQPGTSVTIDTGDDRLGNAVWRNGLLWTGGNTGIDAGVGPQSGLFLIAADTSGFTLPVREDLFSSAGTSFAYPGIALDGAGTPFIALSRGSASLYMSAGAFAWNVATGTLMTAGVANGGAGTSWYDCTSICGQGPSRWGDYSGAAVDPGNTREVWTAAEYSGATPADRLNWATVMNRLTVSAPTITSISAHSSRTSGGTTVTVTGSEFDPASSAAVFGGVVASATQWIDDRHFVVRAPPHAAGTVGVAAQTAYGISGTLANAFTYTPPPLRTGYWMVAADGGVFAFGTAPFRGSMGDVHLNQPVVGMAAAPDGRGYWLVARDGGVFSFGSAQFHGSTGGIHLNQPVVGMAATPDGQGYWLVAADGGVFSFGSAQFHGSTGNIRLNQPIVGMAATPTGGGYWLVASDGGVFSFGDAAFHGSTGNLHLNKPIVGMVPLSWGGGYWLVASDGGVFAFAAPYRGSTGALRLNQPVLGMDQSGDDNGYWLVARDGGIFAFPSAAFAGSMGAMHLNQPIVGMAAQPD